MEQVIPAEWRRLNKVHRDALTVLAVNGGEATIEAIHDGMGGADMGDAPSKPWVSTNVSDLEDEGLVTKDADTDQRYTRVTLTDAGYDVLEQGVRHLATRVRANSSGTTIS